MLLSTNKGLSTRISTDQVNLACLFLWGLWPCPTQEANVNILLSGGASDLATVLTPQLLARGDHPVRIDIRQPQVAGGTIIHGSILDRPLLQKAMSEVDVVVHIAAWHGIHEVTGQKDGFDFWDLNATGTFNIFETAMRSGVKQILHISTTSIYDGDGYYRQTKLIAEEIAQTFAARHNVRLVILRPRAFIPAWNSAVYGSFIEWANWFVKGAVHIDDFARAVLLALDFLADPAKPTPLVADIDGAYDYTAAQLANWDVGGPGSTFRATYPEFAELAEAAGLDISVRPDILARTEAQTLLGYEPHYSLANLLAELAERRTATD